ncbi:MAG TPA: tRNA (adenosine(37)-N6)-threonylcarbamoyltransferase complex transferase subunit TsaD [Candidatus Saccharibacteria bacterium]|jgi:N6-L-threonylcarbamoyladenine synthase|nr:tRNA (adenosine(37)-N6)-threonylcarbamoyltransferase complex transferase subunit TsaD [Candidatus Saccharibacteria bacterium]HMT55864.1 tRNA (adenosine(37)-N6)-threonylcarbamoyltransferase complex transferase subunit TsaD [Candidatus Saccharibacteria bacterium]
MIILGIETSCDETAAAVVRDGVELITNVVATSMDLHAVYGGVVPEIAARSHIESIIPVIEQAVAPVGWDAIDGIAVTNGAGLGGSLLVGVTTARTLAITKLKPLYAVNHVEGHVYANFLTKTQLEGYTLPERQPEIPMLALIVSGGHTQLVFFRNHFDYTVLGKTRDDAIGEAFDKVAKITGLPYPGGPNIAKAALKGDSHAYRFPKSRLDEKYEFSFSGLKTAVLRTAQEVIGEDFTFPSFQIPDRLTERQRQDIAASFQRIAIETVVDKAVLACEEFQPKSVVIAGGVAANQELRRQLSERLPFNPQYTDIKLCTDNGAMIATLGCFKAMLESAKDDPYTLSIEPNLKM